MSKKQETKSDELVSHFEDPLLTLTECGLLIGKSRNTIARWADEGLIRTFRDPSNLRRVRRSELVKFYGATALSESKPLP